MKAHRSYLVYISFLLIACFLAFVAFLSLHPFVYFVLSLCKILLILLVIVTIAWYRLGISLEFSDTVFSKSSHRSYLYTLPYIALIQSYTLNIYNNANPAHIPTSWYKLVFHLSTMFSSTISSSSDLTLALANLKLQSSPTVRQPLESFHLFTSLAPELRLKIWSFACTPRVLPIRHLSSTTATLTFHSRTNRTSNTITRFSTTSPPPALLSVCAEARAQALRIYTLTFATPTSPGTIYFCPGLDTLYFPRYREMGYDETVRDFMTLVAKETPIQEEPPHNSRRRIGQDGINIWENVHSIALDYVDVNIKRPWESYNKACLIRSFPRLEEICLVINTPNTMTITNTLATQRLEDVETNRKTVDRERKQQIEFVKPKISPEKLLRWWVGFRQGFAMEEKTLERASTVAKREYQPYALPVVNLVVKSW